MPNNTIVLKGDLHRWHEEGRAYDGSIKPGYLCERRSDGKVQAHSTRGGRAIRLFAKEDGLRGGNVDGAFGTGQINGGSTYYVTDDLVLMHKAIPGDQIQAVLQLYESVSAQDWAISYGNGKVCKAASAMLSEALGASTAITNTTVETVFSNGTATILKNTLKVGDLIRVRIQGIATATNSTDTLTVKVYLGATQIATTGALDVANNDIFTVDLFLTVRTIGAGGTFIGYGTVAIGPVATTAKIFNIASTAIDTTVDNTITDKATWSVASAGNSVRQDVFLAEHVSGTTSAGGPPTGVGDVIGQFLEALDLSAASADDFVKLEVV